MLQSGVAAAALMTGVLVGVKAGVEVVEVCTVTVLVVVRVEVRDSVSPAPPFATAARAGATVALTTKRVLRSCILIQVAIKVD